LESISDGFSGVLMARSHIPEWAIWRYLVVDALGLMTPTRWNPTGGIHFQPGRQQL
jgi:hypothetical protein